MKSFITHARTYIFHGLLAIIPIVLCAVAIQLLYVLIDKKIVGFLDNFIQVRKVPGLGILLVLVALYFLGLILNNIIGRQFLKFIESITKRIPLIKTIYAVGKQLSESLSTVDGEKQAFKKAVLVKLDGDGLMVPAFVMNSMKGKTDEEEFLFVLIPTSPTPASGFVCVVRSSQIVDPGWTIEECLKAIVSVGIVAPKWRNLSQ